MKPRARSITPALLLLATLSHSGGQGLINFNNRVTSGPNPITCLIYGLNPANPLEMRHGNAAQGVPAGTQIYPGALLTGTGFTAELWAAPLAAPTLAPVPGARTTFRTGGGAGLFVALPGPVAIPGIPAGQRAQLQVRVWDNQGGQITNWDQVECYATQRGWSEGFESLPLAAVDATSVPSLYGLTSFNIVALVASGTRLRALPHTNVVEGESLTLQLTGDPIGICLQPVQWQHNFSTLTGESGVALRRTNITANSAGRYEAMVSTFTNAVVHINVYPRPVLQLNGLDPGGQLSLSLEGAPLRYYQIETSPNLATWTNSIVVFNPTGQVSFTNLTTGASRFLRARVIP